MIPPYRRVRPFIVSQNEPVAINWRRGLFRIWLLLAAAWIMGWAIYMILDALGRRFEPGEYLMMPVLFFGPPIAVLILGLAAGWAFRGFKMESEQPKQ
jgi:hypothetical protein